MPVATSQRLRPARHDDETDAELVARVRGGDVEAYGAIYSRHAAAVRRTARARLSSACDPADVVQDTFAVAWTHLHALRRPDRLRPWLLQIAARTAIDHGRRARRAPVDPGDHLLDQVEDRGPSPDDAVALAQAVRDVTAGIEGLSQRDATAIALAAHLGFGPDEIAVALGVTPGNAKVILHRARRRLRAALPPAA